MKLVMTKCGSNRKGLLQVKTTNLDWEYFFEAKKQVVANWRTQT